MSDNSSRAGAGVGAGTVILIVLAILKLAGLIQLSWPLVIAASFIPFALYLAIVVLLMGVALVGFCIAGLADMFTSIKRR